jgi:hypothetical protein
MQKINPENMIWGSQNPPLEIRISNWRKIKCEEADHKSRSGAPNLPLEFPRMEPCPTIPDAGFLVAMDC